MRYPSKAVESHRRAGIPELDHAQCAERVRCGDRSAFEILFRAYSVPLCAFALRYVKVPEVAEGVKVHGIPLTQIAIDLGRKMVKNIVALGALQAATEVFPKETFLAAIRQNLRHKCALIPLNEEAFAWGAKAFQDIYGDPDQES